MCKSENLLITLTDVKMSNKYDSSVIFDLYSNSVSSDTLKLLNSFKNRKLAFITGTTEYIKSMMDDLIKDIPKSYAISKPYPNPFNPIVNFNYSIPFSSKMVNLNISIYNVKGQSVFTFSKHDLVPGYYKYTWNARNKHGSIASGIYVARTVATVNNKVYTNTFKLNLIK